MTQERTIASDQEPPGRADGSAERRTSLAVERTELAWWRTGLTALAVAIGIGRVVPAVDEGATLWPYAAVGAGFALYGIWLFLRGTQRARGRGATSSLAGDAALAAAGPLLGVLVIILIVTA